MLSLVDTARFRSEIDPVGSFQFGSGLAGNWRSPQGCLMAGLRRVCPLSQIARLTGGVTSWNVAACIALKCGWPDLKVQIRLGGATGTLEERLRISWGPAP